jgi:hypothetical protein
MEKNIKQMKLKLINNENNNNNKKFINASTNYNFFKETNNNLKLNFYYVNKNIIYPVINKNNNKLTYREYYNYNNNNNNDNNKNNFHKFSKSNEIRNKFKIKINENNLNDINKKYTEINSPNHINKKFRFLSIDYVDKIFNNNSNKIKFKNNEIYNKINENFQKPKKKRIFSRNNINEIYLNSNENYSNRNLLTSTNFKKNKKLNFKTFHLDTQKNIENFKLLKLLINNQRKKNHELIEGIKEEILKNEFLLKTYNVTLFNKNLHILNQYKINKNF